MDRQAPERRDRHGVPLARGDEREAHAREPGRLDLHGSHAGVVRKAVGHAAGHCSNVHVAHDRVVGVEDGRPAWGERLEQLALGPLDRAQGADPRQVDGLDRGDDADRRAPNPCQVGDLAADVHAHLEHRGLVLGAELEHGQRQPDLVVLVALVLERQEARREDGRDRLLR